MVVQEGTLENKILIIDDSPDLLRIVQVCLERENYKVFTATNGKEGLQRTYSVQPDLIILDVMMPSLSGYEVCQLVRCDPDLSNTHIIMLTAKGQEADQGRSIEVGANEYITKPFDPNYLIGRVADVLGVKV